jgi:hypothetical protein
MKIFDPHFLIPASVGLVLAAPVCLGGNQEWVEKKTTELHSLNEQVMKQAAPAGLKEGDKVEVKAMLRVERAADQETVIRDVKIESVKVDGKLVEAGAAEKQQAEGVSGVRPECLRVPETGCQPAVGRATPPHTTAVKEEKLPMEGAATGFHQERLNVPSVKEK